MIDQATYFRLVRCVQAQMAGEMTAHDVAELESLVLSDPAVLQAYHDCVVESAELQRWAELTPRDLVFEEETPEVDMDYVMSIIQASAQETQPTGHPTPEPKGHPTDRRLVFHPSGDDRQTKRIIVVPTWLVWVSLATAAVIALAFIFNPGAPTPSDQAEVTPPPQTPQATAQVPDVAPAPVVAVLMDQVDARWDLTGTTIGENGEIVEGSVLRLDAGLARLRFDNGAELILEAPASVEMLGEQQIKLIRGRLVATCPASAVGFTVQTNGMDVVDLGTEFGVEVQTSGAVNAQVFVGEVQVHNRRDSGQGADPATSQRSLVAGQAVQQDPNLGTISLRPAEPYRFVREREFRANVLAAEGSAYDRWVAASLALRRDPDLVAYYTFEKDNDDARRLTNLSAPGEELDGWMGISEELPEWVQGRFDNKQGLRFNNVEPLDGNRIEGLRVPYNAKLNLQDQFTIAAWIKTPANDVVGGGPIVSYRDAPAGNMAYQLDVYYAPSQERRRPNIQFGSGDEVNTRPHSRVFKSFSTGRMLESSWHHLVVVYANEQVKFYLDGQLVHEERSVVPPATPKQNTGLLIGAAPWPMSEGGDLGGERAVGFVGVIDELAIFRRALGPNDIAKLYRDSAPEANE